MLSPIDKIFAEIFGYSPKKAGEAYEKIAAIASHIVEGGNVKHDSRLRGDFSRTLYQIDVEQQVGQHVSAGEAKDYTLQRMKVGRSDLQKLAGALPDLNQVSSGKFFSATGYTLPAQKYAHSAAQMIGKPITLYQLRPSVESDEKGTIKTIVLSMTVILPIYDEASWTPIYSERGKQEAQRLLASGQQETVLQEQVGELLDQHGTVKLTIHELTSLGYGELGEDDCARGCFVLKDLHFRAKQVLLELNGLEYCVPHSRTTTTLRITNDSKARFVLLDDKCNKMRVLSDKALRRYTFADNGDLVVRAT